MARPTSLLCLCVIVLLTAACATDTSSPSPTRDLVPYARTYTVTAVDSFIVPYVRSQDGNCQQINTGGWLTLSSDGSYQLLLDNVRSLCVGAPGGGGDAIYQAGTYVVSAGILHLSPTPPQGPASSGRIWQATPLPGGGFAQAAVQLTFNERLYDLPALFQPPQ